MLKYEKTYAGINDNCVKFIQNRGMAVATANELGNLTQRDQRVPRTRRVTFRAPVTWIKEHYFSRILLVL